MEVYLVLERTQRIQGTHMEEEREGRLELVLADRAHT